MGRGMSYYDVLGIARSSDDVEIKRAYRRLALKYHPDTDPSETAQQEFVAICEAYDVLSNPKTKGFYDLYGEDKLKSTDASGAQSYAFDQLTGPQRVFGRFFGTHNPYEALSALSAEFEALTATKKKPTPAPKTVPLQVTLEEAYHGASKQVSYERRVLIEGAEDEPQWNTVTVQVRPGALEGTVFVVPGCGDELKDGKPQDLQLVLQTLPHSRFGRRGYDLIHKASVPLYQALTGATVTVQTPDLRVLNVPISEIVTPGHTCTLPGEGMPKPDNTKGDLIIQAELLFPASLTEPQKHLLRAAFFLPAKLNDAQKKALWQFEAAFKDDIKGWSAGITNTEL